MLEGLKKNLGSNGRSRGITKKVVALFAFGAIILVFVFMGVDTDQLGMGGGGVVAQVNNATISVGQFRSQVERMERQFGGANPAFAQFIRRQALEGLINQEVIYQNSQSAGLRVSDEEIRDVILNLEVFQEDGRFQLARYDAVLRNNRLSISQFEVGIRKDAAADRLRRLLTDTVVPTKGEVALHKAAQATKASLNFVSFSQEELAEKLAKEVKYDGVVSEEMKKKIEDYYNKNITDYTRQEEVKAQHILIKTEKRSEKEALAKIEEIAAQAKKDDFAALAQKYSEDAGSQKKGGDLGYFGRGQMVESFEEAAFSLPVGQISEPIKSQFGYHLIKVNDKKAGEVKSLDSVKDEIARIILAAEQVEKDVADLEKALESKEYKEVDRFVRRFGLGWESTGTFDLAVETVPNIGSSEKLLDEAFALSEESPYPREIFHLSGQSFLVKHKAVANEGKAPEEEETRATLAREQAGEALGRLTEQWRNSSDIQRNGRYLETTQL